MLRLLSRPRTAAFLFLTLCGLAGDLSARQHRLYTVERLPLPAGYKGYAAMNDAGDVCVSITDAEGKRPYRLVQGVLERLPDPPGFLGGTRQCSVEDIDAAGNMVGRFATTIPDGGTVAVRWSALGAEPIVLPNHGTMHWVKLAPDGTAVISGWPFSYFAPAWEDEFGWDVEPAYNPYRDPVQVYVWRDGTLTTVPAALGSRTLSGGGDESVIAVNDAGQMAIQQTIDHEPRAMFYDPENGLRELPSLGATLSSPYGLNAHGHAVGAVRFNSNRAHPVLWRDGRALELPILPGYDEAYAQDLNDHDEVVGSARRFSGGQTLFLWNDGHIQDLSRFLPAGWTLDRAYTINASGQILAHGEIAGAQELFLLQPTGPSTTTGGDPR